jgi:excisionase family DNA binding protein
MRRREQGRQGNGAGAMSVNEPKLLYTVQEAATRLGLPATWLYERTRKDTIPCHRFGKYVRFTDADLQAIIARAAPSYPETEGGLR